MPGPGASSRAPPIRRGVERRSALPRSGRPAGSPPASHSAPRLSATRCGRSAWRDVMATSWSCGHDRSGAARLTVDQDEDRVGVATWSPCRRFGSSRGRRRRAGVRVGVRVGVRIDGVYGGCPVSGAVDRSSHQRPYGDASLPSSSEAELTRCQEWTGDGGCTSPIECWRRLSNVSTASERATFGPGVAMGIARTSGVDTVGRHLGMAVWTHAAAHTTRRREPLHGDLHLVLARRDPDRLRR